MTPALEKMRRELGPKIARLSALERESEALGNRLREVNAELHDLTSELWAARSDARDEIWRWLGGEDLRNGDCR